MDAADYAVIDARPRVVARLPADLRPQQHWVDLEHSRMRQTMLALDQAPTAAAGSGGRVRRSDQGPAKPVFNASTWWRAPPADALLTAVIPQKQRFRDSRPDLDLVLLPDEDGEQALLHRVKDRRDWRPGQSPYIEVERSEHMALDAALVQGERIQPWAVTDYLQALRALADELGLPLMETARRFGTISVPAPQEGAPTGWRSHPALGFVKKR